MKTSHHIVSTRYRTTQFITLEQLKNSKIQMKTTMNIKKKLFEKDNIVSNSARKWTYIFVSELLRCDKIVINVL